MQQGRVITSPDIAAQNLLTVKRMEKKVKELEDALNMVLEEPFRPTSKIKSENAYVLMMLPAHEHGRLLRMVKK